MGIGIIANELEILVSKIKDIPYLGIDPHDWQLTWLPGELSFNLLQVIGVEMSIAESMHKLPRLQTCDLSQHHRQKGIGGNIEWHTQEDISTTLIELTRKPAFRHIELKQTMAGGQSHMVDICRIPS
jgi:hypothetical protein